MASPPPGIPEFFAGRHVLVTGATGFLGKVLLEKLLRCCPDIGRIYALIRTKRGKAPAERLQDFRQLPLFEKLLKQNPKAFDKVLVVAGATTEPDLGLSEENQRLIQSHVTVVFHLAATLDWRTSLRRATIENVGGTKAVLDFCTKINNLQALEYTSTAFCHCEEEVLEERTYPPPIDPHRLLSLTRTLDDTAMESFAKTVFGKHPNSYTFTKAVAEALVDEYKDRLPVVMVRPSIVVPSLREPMPGWVDTLNGPIGVMAAAGKGVMRSMMCDQNNHADVMPVDVCINVIIAGTYQQAIKSERLAKQVPVFNACIGGTDPVTWGTVLELGRKKIAKYPFEWALWYPDGNIRTNWWVHTLIVYLFQMVPAYCIDLLLLLAFQERFLVRVQRKIQSGHDLLAFFTMREWRFRNERGVQDLWPRLNAADRETYFINNVLPVDKDAYMDSALFGARTYCLKESPGTLKYCRRRLKLQYVIHRTCIALFYMGAAYMLLSLLGRFTSRAQV